MNLPQTSCVAHSKMYPGAPDQEKWMDGFRNVILVKKVTQLHGQRQMMRRWRKSLGSHSFKGRIH